MELGHGWSRAAPSIPAQLLPSQTVLSHFEVIDTKSSLSSSPSHCSIERSGDKSCLGHLWEQWGALGHATLLTLPTADPLLVDFLLQLQFLADIKTTRAKASLHCSELHVNGSQEHANLGSSLCEVPGGFACHLVHPKQPRFPSCAYPQC